MKNHSKNISLKICHNILGSNSFSNLRSSHLNIFMIYFGNGEKYFLALLIQVFSSKRCLYNNFSRFFFIMVILFHFREKNNKQTTTKTVKKIWGKIIFDFCRFFHKTLIFLECLWWNKVEIFYFTENHFKFIHFWWKTRNSKMWRA